MNSLDSRLLQHGDTFAQKFSRAGQYNYDFGLPGLGQLEKGKGRFTIDVKESADKNREPQQHFVLVRQEQGSRTLEASPRELSLEAGDVVLWSAAESTVPGFSVVGQAEKDSFSSAALTREAVYTHAFGNAGVFAWEDAKDRRIAGKVTVKDAETKTKDEMERYRGQLAEGVVVVISGGKVSPSDVNIIVGQTVFFAVEKGEGISITDTRLKAGSFTVGADPS
jgi:plastocyanin